MKYGSFMHQHDARSSQDGIRLVFERVGPAGAESAAAGGGMDRRFRDGQICSMPVLSPNFSVGTPNLSSIASSRFDIVVSLAWRMWRPPLSEPEAPPARTTG